MKTLGLRIDVDTLRGTRLGVPALCEILGRHGVPATIYFSVGPDNMGRNLWRLLRPDFLKKMLRSKAASLYGWDILLMGTAWPGPRIGVRCEEIIRACAAAGLEMGFHAWDHFTWQSQIDRFSPETMRRELTLGMNELTRILGAPPRSSATPGWRCNDLALVEKEAFRFAYNSDCRGLGPFIPLVKGKPLSTPQIPVSLPAYDELIGADGVTPENYNRRILDLVTHDAPHVYTIHAEAEGIACRALFDDFLTQARKDGIQIVTLGSLLERWPPVERAPLTLRTLPGREGWLAFK